ncbi:MAG: transcriptional regulator, TetR family [Capsulimonas sp.]|nr:transcriptional regulator, TetR family [Capsulimonas sp.]
MVETQEQTRYAPGRPAADEIAERHERLLTIAAEVFVDLGFAGTSMGEIARRAGVSKNTIYARYSTKSELFSGVMRFRADRLLPRFTDVLLTDRGLEKTLQTFGENLLDVMLEPQSMGFRRRMISEAILFPDIARQYWNLGPTRSRKLLSAYLDARAKSGELDLDDPQEAAIHFISLAQGDLVIKAELGVLGDFSPAQRQAAVRSAVRLFLKSYRKVELKS